jgi:hypothetical protein
MLFPGVEQKNASIKLHIPKSEIYYEFILNIKNSKVILLNDLIVE